MAQHGTGYVAMLPPKGEFTEQESDLWPPNRTANVFRAISLVPDAVRSWSDVAGAQYLSMPRMINFGADTWRSINRMQIEIVTGRVSSVNECLY